MHVTSQHIHCFRDRGRLLRFQITTDTSPSDITFRAGAIEKAALSGSASAGVTTVDVDLTASDLDITEGGYDWELVFTVSGEEYTAAYGRLRVSAEPVDDD